MFMDNPLMVHRYSMDRMDMGNDYGRIFMVNMQWGSGEKPVCVAWPAIHGNHSFSKVLIAYGSIAQNALRN